MPDSVFDTITLRDDHPVANAKQAASERATTARRSERAARKPQQRPLHHLRLLKDNIVL